MHPQFSRKKLRARKGKYGPHMVTVAEKQLYRTIEYDREKERKIL